MMTITRKQDYLFGHDQGDSYARHHTDEAVAWNLFKHSVREQDRSESMRQGFKDGFADYLALTR